METLMERWQRIMEAPTYEISTEGKVRNRGTGRVLRPRQNRQGVKIVDLRDAGVTITRSVGALQKRAFEDHEG